MTKHDKYIENVWSKEFLDSLREHFDVKYEDLTNVNLKTIIKFHNSRIANWVAENADGFRLHNKKAGVLVVSKYMPIEYVGKTIEEIMEDPYISDFKKSVLKMRKESTGQYRQGKGKSKGKKVLSLDTFFYTFSIMWFNRKNCDFNKATMYEFRAAYNFRKLVHEKIKEGKEYFEWTGKDFWDVKRATKYDRT